jgi:hypothetical protein
MKPIPSLDEVSPEYAKLTERHTQLMQRAADIDAEIRSVHSAMAERQVSHVNPQADRIAALIDGAQAPPPANLQDRIADLSLVRKDINDAINTLAVTLADERRKASRLIAAQFDTEHREMAVEFFGHLCAAASVHTRLEKLRLRFFRAGVDPSGLTDFARDIMGEPTSRTDTAAQILRDAIRKGYLPASSLPEEFR